MDGILISDMILFPSLWRQFQEEDIRGGSMNFPIRYDVRR